MTKAVADTSIFIAQASGRELGDLPDQMLPVEPEIATCFARLAATELNRGRRLRRHNTWIAATALRHRAAVLAQDPDFSSFEEVEVLRV